MKNKGKLKSIHLVHGGDKIQIFPEQPDKEKVNPNVFTVSLSKLKNY